jgi:hydroxymethylpyrimidine/phosphomethylpyrimidine kinase
MTGTPRILIIAGSDSGGGAGIQADIKTVTMLGGHAMTAITAITAQNTLGVEAIMAVPADMVLKQIDAVVSDIGVDAVKIGMIGSPETAAAVAWRLEHLKGVPIVFDPVMVASSGAVLVDEPTIAAFSRLMKISTVTTPNRMELEALSGTTIRDEFDQEAAAELLMKKTGCRALLAKGGHSEGRIWTTGDGGEQVQLSSEGRVFDYLYELSEQGWAASYWDSPRISTVHDHGTGCTLASGIAVGLGRGNSLGEAVASARSFVHAALAAAPGFGAGHGPMGHWAVGREALSSA